MLITSLTSTMKPSLPTDTKWKIRRLRRNSSRTSRMLARVLRYPQRAHSSRLHPRRSSTPPITQPVKQTICAHSLSSPSRRSCDTSAGSSTHNRLASKCCIIQEETSFSFLRINKEAVARHACIPTSAQTITVWESSLAGNRSVKSGAADRAHKVMAGRISKAEHHGP